MPDIQLKLTVSKETLFEFGGVKIYKQLLHNILDRYGNSEYFDQHLIDLLTSEKYPELK